MTKRRLALALLSLLALGVWLACEWRGIALFLENRRATQQERARAEHQAALDQHVSGYVSDQELTTAALRVTSLAYYGGYVCEWRYAGGQVVYREPERWGGEPVDSPAVQPTEAERVLLADALNSIAKLQLEKQGNVVGVAADGGEVEYEFAVGTHRGRFKIANAEPPHLEQFQHKCRQLLESFKASTGKTLVSSAWTDADDGRLSLMIQVPASESEARQPLVVVTQLRNNTQGWLSVLRPLADAYAARAEDVEIVGSRGRLCYSGPTEESTLGAQAFTLLRPGESAWGQVELQPANHEGLDQPDTYTVRYTYRVDAARATAAGVQDVWIGEIISGPVSVHRRGASR